jgi:hypothetical protein
MPVLKQSVWKYEYLPYSFGLSAVEWPVFGIDVCIIMPGRRLGGVTMVHTSKSASDLDGLS